MYLWRIFVLVMYFRIGGIFWFSMVRYLIFSELYVGHKFIELEWHQKGNYFVQIFSYGLQWYKMDVNGWCAWKWVIWMKMGDKNIEKVAHDVYGDVFIASISGNYIAVATCNLRCLFRKHLDVWLQSHVIFGVVLTKQKTFPKTPVFNGNPSLQWHFLASYHGTQSCP